MTFRVDFRKNAPHSLKDLSKFISFQSKFSSILGKITPQIGQNKSKDLMKFEIKF